MALSNQCLVRNAHQTVKMLEERGDLTMEIIAHCFFGDYGEGKVLNDMRRIVPKAVDGMISKPRKLPWPLNRLPGNNFGSAMAARKEFDTIIGDVLRQRGLDLSVAYDVRTFSLRVYFDIVWSHYFDTLSCSDIELGECIKASLMLRRYFDRPIIYPLSYLSSIMYHKSSTISIIYHLSAIIYHLSSIIIILCLLTRGVIHIMNSVIGRRV